MMSVRTALKLGRVSNLPTVWTNVFAGMVLSGIEPSAKMVVTGGVAASLLYIAGTYLAGTYLNDAFPIAPIVMGLCRVAVYFMAARAVAPKLAPPLYVGAAFLLTYLVLLTTIARGEPKEPGSPRPRLLGRLTAGICIVDGLQILAFGSYWLAGLCAVGFVLTLRLQRRAAGG